MNNEYILITGGAGFIGTNVARTYLSENRPVHIFDNLSRAGVEQNVAELQAEFPGRVLFTRGDVRDRQAIAKAVSDAAVIYHFAAQVAVTTSLDDPLDDAGTNLLGTLNLLESLRQAGTGAPLLFTSTNKVYGNLPDFGLLVSGSRYQPEDPVLAGRGIAENQPLQFLSPYGCSKGSADQYVLDYAHSYQLPAAVFRMSCIYGPYQRGSEDQGWVAHFVGQTLRGEPITIYGDGKQVRDLLFVQDLAAAMRAAIHHIGSCAGHAFNIGGGAKNSASLIEVLRLLHSLVGNTGEILFANARPGDQRWYVSDTTKARETLAWQPQTSIREGLQQLINWYSSRVPHVRAAMQEA